MSENSSEDQPWPNRLPVVDGVVPSSEVPQDPDFLTDDPDADEEMTD